MMSCTQNESMDRVIKLPFDAHMGVSMAPIPYITKELSKYPRSHSKRKAYYKSDWLHTTVFDPKNELNHLTDSRIQTLLILLFGRNVKEYVYRDFLTDNIPGAKSEVIIKSGVVDVLTPDKVIEVKKSENWKHALGQSLAYAAELKLKPCVSLIGKLQPISKKILLQYKVDNIQVNDIK